VRARQLLKRAALEHEKGFADKEEAQIEARAAERQMDEMIRLSTNTGAPTLKNRTTRQMELKLRELTQRRDGAPPDKPATEVDVSVFRSYVAGEFVSVGENMKALPPEVFFTFFSFFFFLIRIKKNQDSYMSFFWYIFVCWFVCAFFNMFYRFMYEPYFTLIKQQYNPLLQLANTLTMQFGIQRIYMPRNSLTGFEAHHTHAKHLSAKNFLHVAEIDVQVGEKYINNIHF
jgi:hypothetical protein